MRQIAGLLLASALATPALAVGRLADVSVIDRDTGEVLPTHYHRGEYWVAGRPGAHYAVKIQSQDGRRLLAVTSVDGVNVLTGETAAFGQRGYVFDPWTGYDIAGWRKSDREIAAFTFTSIPKSYAARTGRPQNVGVIGVALFRELPPPVAQVLPAPPPPLLREPVAPAAESTAESTADASAAARADVGADVARSRAERRVAPLAAPSLGTGHGRREYSSVTQVAFERASASPDEVIRIRYDSHDNLVAMGVIRRPPPPRRPEAFPDSPRLGYVPDP